MKTNSKGSAYAWAMFFVFMWIFATVWFFALGPLWNTSLETANLNFAGLTGASAFYTFYASIYPYIGILVFIFAMIGFLKYAANKKREGL